MHGVSVPLRVVPSPTGLPSKRGPGLGSPPGSSVHGIFQARVLEWVASAFSGLMLLGVENLLIYLWLSCVACVILVLRTGIEPGLLAVTVES